MSRLRSGVESIIIKHFTTKKVLTRKPAARRRFGALVEL